MNFQLRLHLRERLSCDSLAVRLHLLYQAPVIAAMPNILRAINERRDCTVGQNRLLLYRTIRCAKNALHEAC